MDLRKSERSPFLNSKAQLNMVTWQTDRGTLGPSFLYHEHGKICLRLIVRQFVRLRLRVRLRRVHKAKLKDVDLSFFYVKQIIF